MQQRRCSKCQQPKDLAEFRRHKRGKNGRSADCNTCHSSQNHLYYLDNKDKYRIWRQNYKEQHTEAVRQQTLDWRKSHPERVRQIQTTWRRNNKALQQALIAAWTKAHPEKGAEKTSRYRARKRHAPRVEAIDRALIFLRDQWICQLCHRKVQPEKASIDHVIPLSKGGEHTYRNLVLVHRLCNSSKGNRAVPQQMRLLS